MFNNVTWGAREGLDSEKISRMTANDELSLKLAQKAPSGLLAAGSITQNFSLSTTGSDFRDLYTLDITNREYLSSPVRRFYKVNISVMLIDSSTFSNSTAFQNSALLFRFYVEYPGPEGNVIAEPSFYPFNGLRFQTRTRPQKTITAGGDVGGSRRFWLTNPGHFFFTPPNTSRFQESPNRFLLRVAVAQSKNTNNFILRPDARIYVEDVGALPDGVSLP